MKADASSRLVLVAVVPQSQGISSFRFERVDGGELEAWLPGAHLDLILASGLVRQYSLCGDPADRSAYVVAVLDQPGGRGGSREMHMNRVGTELEFRGPKNHFALVEADSYVFIAGGVGITPILPMVRLLAGKQLPWQIAYGGRSLSSMAFVEDILGLAHVGSVQIVPEDEVGFIDLVTLLDGQPPGTAVYCCGPEPLLRAVDTACGVLGLQGGLHVERFASPHLADEAGAVSGEGLTSFEVSLAASDIKIVVGADESILDRVLDVVPDWPWGCHEGYCGSCEAKVLSGTPEHHDDVLSDEERAAGDTMMICVGRSLSSRLVLDI